MTNTKEFYDILDFFENKALKTLYISAAAVREPRKNWPRQVFYTDGAVNEAFKAFLHRYARAKAEYQTPV